MEKLRMVGVLLVIFGTVACGGDDSEFSGNDLNNTNNSESLNNTNNVNNINNVNNTNNANNTNNTNNFDNTNNRAEPADTYEFTENPFVDAATEPTSTFSIDVDTGSYALMRHDILRQQLPDARDVRIEEFVNYFDYAYPAPAPDQVFGMQMEIAPSHFEDGLHLLRIGIQSKDLQTADLKPNNLVFLVDVSGSMQSADKLPVVQHSLRTLVANLRPVDRVAIVTYASREEVLLQSTAVTPQSTQTILDVIDTLSASGSTNGEAGLTMAYDIANANKIADGNNRVILMTDGDLNVGLTGQALIDYISAQRDNHITLTAAGFGRDGYNDFLLEQLANDSNGYYVYIDSTDESTRIFGTNLASTLQVVATDVKLQLEFNPGAVVRYRLVGYENRLLDNQDFNDDTKDAGEIGPGHRVTAFYELDLAETPTSSVLADLRIRHKQEFGDMSLLEETTLKTTALTQFADASADFRFAAAVVEYAQILRGSQYSQDARFDEVIQIATDTSNSAPDRLEFIDLATQAQALWP